MRVLIVEDDKVASNMIAAALRKEGFSCSQTDLGEDALKLAKISEYDILVLDMVLPDSDGLEIIRRLRASKNEIPIVVLSALQGINDKVMALSKGADDFICKPISTIELIARLRAVARRRIGYSNSVVAIGQLSVNLHTKSASIAGATLKLTNKEYSILEVLALKQGHILNKESFLSHLYDESCAEQPGDKIVDVFMCKLRKKIQNAHPHAGNYIETVWGRGYMLVDPDQKQQTNAIKI